MGTFFLEILNSIFTFRHNWPILNIKALKLHILVGCPPWLHMKDALKRDYCLGPIKDNWVIIKVRIYLYFKSFPGV